MSQVVMVVGSVLKICILLCYLIPECVLALLAMSLLEADPTTFP